MSDLFALLSQVGVYPALLLLWYQQRETRKALEDVLNFLEKNCPECGAVRILTPGRRRQ